MGTLEQYLLRGTEHEAQHAVSSTHLREIILLRPKSLPQHPILEHLQLTFVPQFERPSFTHTTHQEKKDEVSLYNLTKGRDGKKR